MDHALDAPLPHAGDILGGRYVLTERIGAGGMGRVFRARDEVLRRDVAVKIFFTDRSDEAEPLRRMSEARALAALDHPSLVTLYDARLDAGDHVYLVMELIDGPSLQRRIEQGPLSPVEVAGILSDLAAAVAVVHDAGIVHRDIKPSNVLLRPVRGTARGVEAVLADFGVAHLVDATRLTTPGTVIGTAAYLAPEQVRGEAPQAASDVYALGLLTIEALTRLHPFGGGSVQETLLARLARQPDVPSTLGYAWRSLLTAMTAHDPSSRPSASDVAARAAVLAAGAEAVAADTGPVTVTTDAAWADLGLAGVAMGGAVATERLSAPSTVIATPADSASLRGETEAAAVPSRRRHRVWAGVGAAAAVVAGHLVAFSLAGAGGAPASGNVASPRPSVIAETPAPTPSTEPSAPAVQQIADTGGDGSSGQAPADPVSVDQPTVDQAPGEQAPADTTPVEPVPAGPPISDPAPGTGPGAGNGSGNGAGNGGGPGSGRGKGEANGPGASHGNGKGSPGAP
ncbi:Serine/threonine protein kinase [Microbacterium hydrothermale]|nr:Serine/threonine protein kinase [Microbacterium hydrothermale]